MNKILILTATILGCLSVTSCASIINGRRQNIDVSSNPVGATVSDGVSTWTTPAKISLKRGQKHLLTLSKPGYETQAVELHRAISGAVFGNILLGGFIGWGVDACTGAQWKLIPETVNVQLRPITPPFALEASKQPDPAPQQAPQVATAP